MSKYRLIVALLLGSLGFLYCTEKNQKIVYETGVSKSNRPQEPKSLYPYIEEEVSFKNLVDGVVLAGTLTLPSTKGPFPAVILLHGSAPLDRDCSIFGHKPFLVWADYLTRQGIAVLRFDKRSAGKSTGDYSTATLEDFAADALAGVQYLKTRKEINQIGLIGHSEGGMTAPFAASKSSDVDFIVMMAAPSVNSEELVCRQEVLLQRADGVPEEMIEQNHKFRKELLDLLKGEKNREIAEGKMRKVITNYFSGLNSDQKKIAETYLGSIEDQIGMFNSTWFRYGLDYDPLSVLKKVKVPILILNGELDLIVPSEPNLELASNALEKIGHVDYTICKLPKLNHAFQTCQIGSMAECAQIEETVAPQVLSIMAKWIQEKTK